LGDQEAADRALQFHILTVQQVQLVRDLQAAADFKVLRPEVEVEVEPVEVEPMD
jgi:hypothetical protein